MSIPSDKTITSGTFSFRTCYTIPLLFAIGLMAYACSDMHNPVSDDSSVSDILLQEGSVTQEALTLGVEKEVTISGYTIKFDDEGSGYNNGKTTFKYTVTRGNDAEGFNFFFLETPSCNDEKLIGHSPTSASTVTEEGIKWTASMGKGESRTYSITYSGKQPTGMIDATIQGSGSGSDVTKEIAGPCKGIFEISGTVFLDEDGDGEKDPGEGGIGNVTVHIVKGSDEFPTTTLEDGSFTFNVVATSGADLNLEVRSETDENDFNGMLFKNFSPTTPALSQTEPFKKVEREEVEVTENNENGEPVTGQNFGFKAETGQIIENFGKEPTDGGTLLKTEKPDFWEFEFKFSSTGRQTVFTEDQLLNFLDKIDSLVDELDLSCSFDFGNNEKDRIKKAQDILTLRNNSTEPDELLADLLAAKLNVVSGGEGGGGVVDENGNPIVEFNNIILKIGAAEVEAHPDINCSLLMNSTTQSTSSISLMSTSSITLLSAFNGSGGGIGD